MNKLNSDEMLRYLIDNAFIALDELRSLEAKTKLTPFQCGIKTAHVEILEFIQRFWEKAEEEGLDWDIELSFPV